MKKLTTNLLLTTLLGVGLTGISSANSQENTLVNIDQGTLRGKSQNGMISWLGIPYASAPPSNAFAAAITDRLLAYSTQVINQQATKILPAYAYEFADRTAPSYLKPTSFALGASHTYELPYIFPDFHGSAGIPVRLNEMQEALSDKMVVLQPPCRLSSTHFSAADNNPPPGKRYNRNKY
jgi:carboxylesterase type B